MRIAFGAVFPLLFCACIARAQEWIQADISDPPRQSQYIEFTLQGKFLQAPPSLNDKSPMMIIHCQPGRYSSGHMHGKLLAGLLYMGAAVGDSVVGDEIRNELFSSKSDPGGYYVEFSLDDGKVQTEHWDNLLNYQLVGFGSRELNNILWGQLLPNKENINPPVKKFVIAIQRYIAEKIVMQFDMPDPTKVSELCGCTYFKEKK